MRKSASKQRKDSFEVTWSETLVVWKRLYVKAESAAEADSIIEEGEYNEAEATLTNQDSLGQIIETIRKLPLRRSPKGTKIQ